MPDSVHEERHGHPAVMIGPGDFDHFEQVTHASTSGASQDLEGHSVLGQAQAVQEIRTVRPTG